MAQSSSEDRAKKFLEGWVQHKTESTKGWKKYWLVLRGDVIFLFTSDKPNKENMVGTLNLGNGASICNLKSKKGYKFELSTTSNEREAKRNVFKFSKQTDCHLWKAYIVAIATGTIPGDIRLLPGQQSDIYEAMIEVRKQAKVQDAGSPVKQGEPLVRQGDHRPPNNVVRDSVLSIDNELDDPAVLQLNRRLEELAKRAINETDLAPSESSWPINEIPNTLGPKSLGSPLSLAESSLVRSPNPSSSGSSSSMNGGTPASGGPSSRASFLFSHHAFYSDELRNSETPKWFVNCSRDQAEEILKTSTRFGTVLMRASSKFPENGQYVISFRREIQRKTVVSHYNIIRNSEGFKIDVENQHAPMSNLSNVLEFFMSGAGKTAQPLTSNDLTELLGKYQASAFPSVIEEGEEDDDTLVRERRGSSDNIIQHQPNNHAGSNRSSTSVKSSTGSPGSTVSRASFDLTKSSTPTDRRRSSASSSGVFYGGQGSVSERPDMGGSPASHSGGSAAEIVSGVPAVQSVVGARLGSIFRANRSVSEDPEIYTNQAEVVGPQGDTPGSTERASLQSTSPAGSTISSRIQAFDRGSASGSDSQSTHGSVFYSDSASEAYSRRESVPEGYNATRRSYGSSANQNNRSRSGSHESIAPIRQNFSPKFGPPPTPAKPGAQEIYRMMKPPSVYSYGEAYQPVSKLNVLPPPPPAKPGAQEIYRMMKPPSISSYGTAEYQPAFNLNDLPPPPPVKPGPQEIYQLMKPPPSISPYATAEEVYHASSTLGIPVEEDDPTNRAPTSVKELARMIKCSLEK